MKKTPYLAFGLLTLLALIFAGCKDECKDVSCLNGGTCIEGTCECADGYEGADCGVEERAKFLGTYEIVQTCNPTPNQYVGSISSKSGTVNEVEFSDFVNLGSSDIVYGIVDKDSISIPNQPFDGTTVEGIGEINGDEISLSYTYGTLACTETYTKQ